MSLSDHSEDSLLDHVLGTTAYTPATTMYLALSTTEPADAGTNVTEHSGDGYVRKAITFAAASARAVAQNADVNFDEATASWGTITHYAIYDAVSGGNMLAHGNIDPDKLIASGKTPKIVSGEVIISFTTGGITTFLANELLDLMFRNQAYSQPTLYVGLIETTDPDDDSTGSNIDELEMTGYARELAGAFSASSGGSSDNDALIDFGALTGTTETIIASVICDALTGGNALFYDTALADIAVSDGDSVQYAAGAFDISIA